MSFVAPVVAPVSSHVVRGSSLSSICCRSWLQWLLLVAPVAPVSVVVHGSSLQYLLSFMAPVVAPVSVVRVSSLQYLLSFVFPVSSIYCRSWLQSSVSVSALSFVSPVSVASGSSICRLWL